MASRLSRLSDDDDEASALPIAEINVTPMVDVMLVLLIIFMVAAPLMMAGVPLQLPKTAAARVEKPQDPLILSIDRDGQTFIGPDLFTASALAARLQSIAAATPDRVVYVRGDRAVLYGRLMTVMGTVSSAGFSHVSLLAEQMPPAR